MSRPHTRRFMNPKPTKFGKIGHPGFKHEFPGKMYRCAGVMFTDKATGSRWTLRVYFSTESYPEVRVWTRSDYMRRTTSGIGGFGNQVVVPDAEVPPEVVTFGWAELVRLRLRGGVAA